ncbi:MAG TPA: radical SAM family heme chaperone HemW [Candidatus Acidoferrales bacterium]|nr:radical SAM family heme chaperone HemW [Candidatus Acidoferrales bacterium]
MSAGGVAGVYVHLPFCPYVCPYCDFAKWPMRRSAAARYLEALQRELHQAPKVPAKTAFFGGGTPNVYPVNDLTALIAAVREHFSLPPGAEFTVELNPDLALCESFEAYRAAGVTRLSIGVQSFDEAELRLLGRRHTAADVREVVRRARAAGFDNLSVDLMFALPGQTQQSWQRSLAAAIALECEHLSAYGLTIEEGTPFAQWQRREPGVFADSDAEAELYALAIEQLAGAGYEQYEISNFARSGFACAHNRQYWNNEDYLGFGVSATSYRGGRRQTTTRDLETYCQAALEGLPIPAESEELLGAARAGEAAMLALRRREGVELADFAARYAVDFLQFYRPVIAELEAAGMLQIGTTHVALTERGRFVANDVCGAFISHEGAYA